MSKVTPSPFQKKIFHWVEHGSGSGIVNAVAGSGKTWTIVKACDYIPKDRECLFLAFNKSIAVELGKKVPEHVEAKTLNALGHRAWVEHVGRVVLNDRKTYDICKRMLIGHEKRLSAEIRKLVGLAKAFGIAPKVRGRCGYNPFTGLMGNSFVDYMELVRHFDIDIKITDERTLVELTEMVLEESVKQHKVIDYDDQLWMPVITGINVKRYDWVIVDEAQDLSPVQRKLLHMSLKDDGRLLAVGDPYQAIYGFRGAASDSMDLLREEFSCHEMPLSICYRCAKSVVVKAQEVVAHIEPSETAPEGLVKSISTQEYPYKPGDMVICRNAAPLVRLAYELLAQRVPVIMMGRDIGEGLVKLIDKLKPKGIDGAHGLRTKLEQWTAKEVRRALEDDREERVQSIEDKHDSIVAFLHKAKGLEEQRVFVYRPDLMPSRYANLAWQLQQENNLIYVAYTRAKSELYLVEETEDGETAEPKSKNNAGDAAEAPVRAIAEAVDGVDAEGCGEGRTRQRANVA
jgi:superfamily I DNA/RNA helicase